VFFHFVLKAAVAQEVGSLPGNGGVGAGVESVHVRAVRVGTRGRDVPARQVG